MWDYGEAKLAVDVCKKYAKGSYISIIGCHYFPQTFENSNSRIYAGFRSKHGKMEQRDTDELYNLN